MLRVTQMLGVLLLAGILIVSCSNQQPTESNFENLPGLSAAIQLTPTDIANIQTVKLNLYVAEISGQPVNVHRVTEAWQENEVTYNSFGGAYDADIHGTFVVDALGWTSVDITGLMMGWLDGTWENYGLLLDEVEKAYPRSRFNSREALTNHPYIEICFATATGSICEQFPVTADTYVYEYVPTLNAGPSDRLYVGWKDETDLEKQALLSFDIEIEKPVEFGCTHCVGFWKAHSGFYAPSDLVTPLLPIWLGDAGGSKSIEVTTASQAVSFLEMWYCQEAANDLSKLYAQLLAAKLNINNGASDAAIADVIVEADAFLADHDCADWYGLTKAERKVVHVWKKTLDNYNSGMIGPGACGCICTEDCPYN